MTPLVLTTGGPSLTSPVKTSQSLYSLPLCPTGRHHQSRPVSHCTPSLCVLQGDITSQDQSVTVLPPSVSYRETSPVKTSQSLYSLPLCPTGRHHQSRPVSHCTPSLCVLQGDITSQDQSVTVLPPSVSYRETSPVKTSQSLYSLPLCPTGRHHQSRPVSHCTPSLCVLQGDITSQDQSVTVLPPSVSYRETSPVKTSQSLYSLPLCPTGGHHQSRPVSHCTPSLCVLQGDITSQDQSVSAPSLCVIQGDITSQDQSVTVLPPSVSYRETSPVKTSQSLYSLPLCHTGRHHQSRPVSQCSIPLCPTGGHHQSRPVSHCTPSLCVLQGDITSQDQSVSAPSLCVIQGDITSQDQSVSAPSLCVLQ